MRMFFLPMLLIVAVAGIPQSGTDPKEKHTDTAVGSTHSAWAFQSGADSTDRILRLSAKVFRASAVRTVEPAYPPLAKAAGVRGQVLVDVVVDENGRVLSVNAISGHPLLRSAAESAATSWAFRPAVIGDRPVKVKGLLVLKFQANDTEIERLKARLRDEAFCISCYDELANAYMSLARYEDAIGVYKQAILLDSTVSEYHYGLGKVYLEIGQYQEAADQLRESASLWPQLSVASRDLGAAEEKLGHYDLAIRAYEDSIRASEDPEVMSDLGSLYNKLGRLEDAIQVLEKGAEIDDSLDGLHFELGLAYVKIGYSEKARLEYQKLKELGSSLADELLGSMPKRWRR